MGANRIDFLGVRGLVNPTTDQASALSYAEKHWNFFSPEANTTISERGARDLIGETLHHPAMDEIPHIDHIRRTFNPETHVRVVNDLPVGIGGQLETSSWGPHTHDIGRQLIRLNDLPGQPLRTSTVTHELSHLLSYPSIQGITWANAGRQDRMAGIGHSWPMTRAHIHAARTALGNDAADTLKSIYRAQGISFGHRNI